MSILDGIWIGIVVFCTLVHNGKSGMEGYDNPLRCRGQEANTIRFFEKYTRDY